MVTVMLERPSARHITAAERRAGACGELLVARDSLADTHHALREVVRTVRLVGFAVGEDDVAQVAVAGGDGRRPAQARRPLAAVAQVREAGSEGSYRGGHGSSSWSCQVGDQGAVWCVRTGRPRLLGVWSSPFRSFVWCLAKAYGRGPAVRQIRRRRLAAGSLSRPCRPRWVGVVRWFPRRSGGWPSVPGPG